MFNHHGDIHTYTLYIAIVYKPIPYIVLYIYIYTNADGTVIGLFVVYV